MSQLALRGPDKARAILGVVIYPQISIIDLRYKVLTPTMANRRKASRTVRAAARLTQINQNSNLRQQLSSAINGRVIRPPPDPRSVKTQPWNSLRLYFESSFPTTGGDVTTDSVRALFCEQLDLPLEWLDTKSIEFQVRSVRAWNLSSANLSLTANSFINVTQANGVTRISNLMTIADEPGRNHWAKVGYVWPSSHQKVVFTSNFTPAATLFRITTEQDSQIVVHLDILWRWYGGGTIPVPTEWQSKVNRAQDSCCSRKTPTPNTPHLASSDQLGAAPFGGGALTESHEGFRTSREVPWKAS